MARRAKKAIVTNAEQRLLNERIRGNQWQTGRPALRLHSGRGFSEAPIPDRADRSGADTSDKNTRPRVRKKTKARQNKKFERFLDSKNKQDTSKRELVSDKQLDRWVINVSHTDLSTQQTKVLAKGLNFSITRNILPKEEFVVAIEKACRTMEADEAEGFRNKVLGTLRQAKCPQSNLTV